MSYTLTGTIFEIGQTETITDKFKKRDIVIETTEVVNGNIYSQFIKIQFSQKKCDVLNNYNVGDRVGQLIILPYPSIETEEVEELNSSERGEGGFGSSGRLPTGGSNPPVGTSNLFVGTYTVPTGGFISERESSGRLRILGFGHHKKIHR